MEPEPGSDEESIYESEESEEEYVGIDDPQRVLAQFLADRAEKESGFEIDYGVVLQDLESDLP